MGAVKELYTEYIESRDAIKVSVEEMENTNSLTVFYESLSQEYGGPAAINGLLFWLSRRSEAELQNWLTDSDQELQKLGKTALLLRARVDHP